MKNPSNLEVIDKLCRAGVRMEDERREAPASQALEGMRFVVTGRLQRFSRAQIESRIKELGGAVGSNVSRNTTYLIGRRRRRLPSSPTRRRSESPSSRRRSFSPSSRRQRRPLPPGSHLENRHYREDEPVPNRHSRESGNPHRTSPGTPHRNQAHTGDRAIYLTRLQPLNFRNYRSLSLTLGPGLVLIQGGNGRGKSNLLEAIYVLAIAKSPRAASERELLHRGDGPAEPYAQVSATVRRSSDDVTLRVDYQAAQTGAVDTEDPTSIRKTVRVNDIPRRATDLVGQMTAVLFGAVDLELVYGSPSARRRYPRYPHLPARPGVSQDGPAIPANRIPTQPPPQDDQGGPRRPGRAHLLGRRDRPGGVVHRGRPLVRRKGALRAGRARPPGADRHRRAAPAISYLPSFDVPEENSEKTVAAAFRASLEDRRARELAQGATLSGPHRDDLRIEIDGMAAGPFASRGQSRTAVLSMRLAEADLLRRRRADGPSCCWTTSSPSSTPPGAPKSSGTHETTSSASSPPRRSTRPIRPSSPRHTTSGWTTTP